MVSWIGWISNNLPLFLTLAGASLVLMEAFAPGAHFVVIGVALLVTGLVGLFLPAGLGILAPIILTAMLLGVGAATLYVYRQFDFYGGKGGEQTSDSDSLRGTMGRVTERVTPTDGEVRIDDGGFNPYYQARSVDGEIPEGTEVMVIDPGGGNVVTVEAVDNFDEIDRELARGREQSGDRDESRDRSPDPTDDESAVTDRESVTEPDGEFEPDTA